MPREKVETGSSARSLEPGASSAARATASAFGEAVEPGEERQVLARGQLRIEKEIVAEDADARAQRGSGSRRQSCRRPLGRRWAAAAWTARRAAWTSRRRWAPARRRSRRARRRTRPCDSARRRPKDGRRRRTVTVVEVRDLERCHAATPSPPPCGPALDLVQLAVDLLQLGEHAAGGASACRSARRCPSRRFASS